MIGDNTLRVDGLGALSAAPLTPTSDGLFRNWVFAWCMAEDATGDLQTDLAALATNRPGRHRRPATQRGAHRRREEL